MADFEGWIFLEDEMPRIGSGARLVTAKVGWKWVKVKSATYPVPQTYTRIHLSKWQNILRRTEKRGIPWKTEWKVSNGKRSVANKS